MPVSIVKSSPPIRQVVDVSNFVSFSMPPRVDSHPLLPPAIPNCRSRSRGAQLRSGNGHRSHGGILRKSFACVCPAGGSARKIINKGVNGTRRRGSSSSSSSMFFLDTRKVFAHVTVETLQSTRFIERRAPRFRSPRKIRNSRRKFLHASLALSRGKCVSRRRFVKSGRDRKNKRNRKNLKQVFFFTCRFYHILSSYARQDFIPGKNLKSFPTFSSWKKFNLYRLFFFFNISPRRIKYVGK